MKKLINLIDVKIAMKDSKFRELLPPELLPDVQKYINSPGCACNLPLYRKIFKDCRSQLSTYFPDRDLADPDEEIKRLAANNFVVINCNIHELEGRLQKLGPGRKSIAITRFEDQITAVVNNLDWIA